MKRMPFERPTNHYDERISAIDEQLCNIIKERKDVSNSPGFPKAECISEWANKFGLYEDFLNALFSLVNNQEQFRPRIEPNGFQKYIPVLKSTQKDEYMFTVTFIRQYQNSSVVNLIIDWDSATESPKDHIQRHRFWELFIGEQYDCRMTGGSGSEGHKTYNFVVSPPLPDNLSGLQFIFKEFSTPYQEKPTGVEIIIDLK